MRPGFSLLELMTALVLGALVCGAVAGALRSAERLARDHAARVAAAEALRIPAVVLSGELRLLEPARDIGTVARDSMRLRAFRGAAVVCGSAGDAVRVRYRGLRNPDSSKDSVVALRPDGRELTLALLATSSSEAGACATASGEALYEWAVGAPLPSGTLLLLFESGSYHLAEGAFRYRRGAAGRQPLTNEYVAVSRSGFRALDASGVEALDPTAVAAIEARLAARVARTRRQPDAVEPESARSAEAAIRLRIPLLNHRREWP